ncbi:MAG: non-canonical purine NTP diphosphatase [Marinifilaceae bacterium]|jgi:XTP/dITP diphosphohydrolase|nr:non-canonical purine NTP diphosphatase [Marinifilaceae bacterium]
MNNKLEIVFATNNPNKLKEIREILGEKYKLLSLQDINCNEEIPEDFETLEENANQKAEYIFKKYNVNVFADDTGLEIDALNGEPGVYSARYAGENKSSEDNMQKVLLKMDGTENRNAKFRTVIALYLEGKKYEFEGEVIGKILEEKHGNEGFGYDPIFMPENYNISFAEMELSEKNKISHRGRAVEKLTKFLKNKTI